MLPRVELGELLLEVDAWTGFTGAFTHASDAGARASDLAVSVCAVLVGQACNVGLVPVTNPAVSALRRGRLAWVAHHYVRAETIAAANAHLVDHQTTIGLAQAWGGGQLASADGLRFVVPVRTVNAGPNPRYFGTGRGVTWLNYLSDQVTGFAAVVVPGTIRDSLFILDGLLEQETSLQPEQITTDTASYSDQVFGLFRLLGYQFSPRLADLSDQRFWRMDPLADYGALNGLARSRINTRLIVDNWEDLLRVAGSLATGAVRASDILRVLQGGGRPTTLGRAIAEYGRIAKTLHLPASGRRAAEPAGVTAPAGPQGLPRPARRAAPALPRGPGGPARRAGAGAERDRAGTPATWTPPSRGCGRRVSRSTTPTWPGCPRWGMRTSTCWAATTSPAACRLAACVRCVTPTGPMTRRTPPDGAHGHTARRRGRCRRWRRLPASGLARCAA
jgi:TnpA family transposase